MNALDCEVVGGLEVIQINIIIIIIIEVVVVAGAISLKRTNTCAK